MEVIYIKQELLINEHIKVAKVQVIDETGEKKGILDISKAIELAGQKNLDLGLGEQKGNQPGWKLMKYGKYKIEQAKKEKEARKNQKVFE